MSDELAARIAMYRAQPKITVAAEQPHTSPHDDRAYRLIRQRNGLSVLLVSDATAVKSAASLCVRVGHFSDPDGICGLAHFCEHMLFLGTEKYPDESEYNQYLNQHGGAAHFPALCWSSALD